VGEKIFFHFFLGDSRGCASLFSANGNGFRVRKTQIENTNHMKYLPTLDLWNHSIQSAILAGQIKLQCGQWVKCGEGKPSRFVKSTGRSLWVAHPQGTPAKTRERFLSLCCAK
jgi:hypothetical protein